MSERENLEACPICGKTDLLKSRDASGPGVSMFNTRCHTSKWIVSCDRCCLDLIAPTKKEAEARWNRRTDAQHEGEDRLDNCEAIMNACGIGLEATLNHEGVDVAILRKDIEQFREYMDKYYSVAPTPQQESGVEEPIAPLIVIHDVGYGGLTCPECGSDYPRRFTIFGARRCVNTACLNYTREPSLPFLRTGAVLPCPKISRPKEPPRGHDPGETVGNLVDCCEKYQDQIASLQAKLAEYEEHTGTLGRSINLLKDNNRLKDEIASLQAQLPERMKDCTIIFKECSEGHGRLTAKNWIPHDCPSCTIASLQSKIEALGDSNSLLNQRLRDAQHLCRELQEAGHE